MHAHTEGKDIISGRLRKDTPQCSREVAVEKKLICSIRDSFLLSLKTWHNGELREMCAAQHLASSIVEYLRSMIRERQEYYIRAWMDINSLHHGYNVHHTRRSQFSCMVSTFNCRTARIALFTTMFQDIQRTETKSYPLIARKCRRAARRRRREPSAPLRTSSRCLTRSRLRNSRRPLI